MDVSKVVYSYFLYSGRFRTSFHFVLKTVFCNRKNSIIRFQTVKQFHTILHFIWKKLRYFNYPVAFLSFRRSYYIFSSKTLIRFIDSYCLVFKIKISGSQSKQFIFTNTALVKNFKSIKRKWLIYHNFSKFQIFLFCPK